MLRDVLRWLPPMPRPPKHPHVLRNALKLLGLTQKELAEELGVASVTIEKFVNGDSQISKGLGWLISEKTGLDFDQLMSNFDPENPRLLPQPERREAWFADGVRRAARLIDASLRASIENGQIEYQADLRYTIVELIEEYGLTSRTKKLLGLTPKESLLFSDPPLKRPRAKSAKKPKRQPL
jgi:transcriptional regulator with XRE-family HTH domain